MEKHASVLQPLWLSLTIPLTIPLPISSQLLVTPRHGKQREIPYFLLLKGEETQE